MKALVALVLALCLTLSGCAPAAPEQTRYTATFLTLFDTVTTMVGFGESEEQFREKAQAIHDELLYYHQLFDIYNDYEGLNNLKTVNDRAGIAPVTVDRAIIDLLLDCKVYYRLTSGRVNAAMGSVLALWHNARSDGIRDPGSAALPDEKALAEAARHMDPECIVIDEANSTVYLSDPLARLDVGAIAKGWATQRVAEGISEGMLLSVGGNVCATGPKTAGGDPWVVGIQHPDRGDENVHTIYITSGSVVTSGDYQRTYSVGGKSYHHIIDPDTLMPSEYWRSVSVVCADSGLADALSTALFLLPLEEGQALAETCGAEVFWIDLSGEEHMTPGFEEILRT